MANSQVLAVQGFVLRSLKYGESSLIFDVFSREVGLMSFIVGGVRKAGLGLSLRPLVLGQFHVYYQEQRDLHRVKEWYLMAGFVGVQQDWLRGNLGLLMAEWLGQCLTKQQVQAELYDLFGLSLSRLELGVGQMSNIPLWFIAQTCRVLGLLPPSGLKVWDYQHQLGLSYEPKHPNFLASPSLDLLTSLAVLPLEAVGDLGLTRAWRGAFLDDLAHFFAYHLDQFKPLKSMQVLREVLF